MAGSVGRAAERLRAERNSLLLGKQARERLPLVAKVCIQVQRLVWWWRQPEALDVNNDVQPRLLHPA